MRHHSEFLMMGIVIFVILLFFQSASAQYAIPRSVFGSGGASLSSSTNKLVGTLGQPFIGTMSGALNKHNAGFWHVQYYLITSVEEKSVEGLPTVYRLEQNYPNPFNPKTKISYSLAIPAQVQLTVCNMFGQQVALLDEGLKPAGNFSVDFNADNLPSGIYYYRLQCGNRQETRQMILIK